MGAADHRHVAFIRAIMIGREGLHREVVLDLFRRAGGHNPVSYIATGNVSFEVAPARLARLVREVEAGIESIVGRPKPLYVRSVAELVAMIEARPFSTAPFDDERGREVVFFRGAVPPRALPHVSPSGYLSVFAAGGRELFAVSRAGDRPPESAGGMIQHLTGELVTARAWSTVSTVVRKLTA